MTTETWSALAELLGLVSSGLLLIPAVALNKHLRGVHDTETTLAASTTELGRAVAERSQPTLAKAKVPKWSKSDENLLVIGILTFGLSCLIKLGIALSPSPPAAHSGQAVTTQAASAPGANEVAR